MKRMMQMWFGIGVGNSILAPIGFLTPGPHWPGVFAGALAIGSFIVLGLVHEVDRRARAAFMKTLSRFRTAAPYDETIQDGIDKIEAKIMDMKPLVQISHDVGFLHSDMVSKGFMPPDINELPEIDI